LLRFDTLRREESVGASALPAPSGIEFNDVDTPGGAIGKPSRFNRTFETLPVAAPATHAHPAPCRHIRQYRHRP
jgi:hypothetical protein